MNEDPAGIPTEGRFAHPWAVATKTAAAALGAFAIPAVGYGWRMRGQITTTACVALALIAGGIIICSIAYAWIGRWLGRRAADAIMCSVLIAAAFAGFIALRHYLELNR